MNIYNSQGAVIFADVPLTTSAELVQELMRSDYAQLSWRSSQNTTIPAGAYITIGDERYSLLEPYSPEQRNEREWEYKPQFHSPFFGLSKVPFFMYTTAGGVTTKEADWSLTDNPANFMRVLCEAILNETGLKYTYAVDNNLQIASATLQFNCVDIISATTEIANAFETELWLEKFDEPDGNNYIGCLHLGKAQFGTAKVLEVENNIQVPSVTSNSEFFNRFYVFGSSRNITQDYQGANVNSIATKRLTLNPEDEDVSQEGYLDYSDGGPVYSKILQFDDIYPSATDLVVMNIRPRTRYVLDENTSKPIIIGGTEAQPVYDYYNIWYMQLKRLVNGSYIDFPFENTTYDKDDNPDGMLLPGLVPSLHFNSGPLAGREFEVIYHEKAETVQDNADTTPFQIFAGDFEIKYQDENGFFIPAMTGLVPQTDNLVVLFNVKMPQAYETSAQARLKQVAIEEINKNYINTTTREAVDKNEYQAKSDPTVFSVNDPGLVLGGKVLYKNESYEKETRVTALHKRLDLSCYQTITFGDEIVKGNIEELKEEAVSANRNIDLLAAISKSTSDTTAAYERVHQLLLKQLSDAGSLWLKHEETINGVVHKSVKLNPVYEGAWTEGFLTAGGPGSGGGGGSGTDLVQVWTSLANRPVTESEITSNIKISALHIPLGSGLAIDASGNIYATNQGVGTVTGISVNGATLYPTDGIVTLPDYPLTASEVQTIAQSLLSLQSQIDSVSARNKFDELAATTMYADMLSASNVYAGAIQLGGSDLATTLSGISTAISDEVTNRNSAIASAIATEVSNRNTAIVNAINALDSVTEAVSSGYFLTRVTITDGKITARSQGNSISGNAATATRLSDGTARSIWGVNYWSDGVPLNVTAAPNLYIARTKVLTSQANDTLLGITAISNAASSGTSGDESRIEWDAGNHAWHFYGGIYADTFVTAGGAGSSGGGGGGVDLLDVWASLHNNDDDYANWKIHGLHIPIGNGLTYNTSTGLIDVTNAGAVDWANVTNKPDSLAGYGITNAYTKTEVDSLIGAIQQFHYEIYPSLPATGAGNVLYLIGPTGEGSDKYEEYVYANSLWTKIGDTSIDLTPYLTKTLAANTYQPIISDLATIRSNAAHGETAYDNLSTVSDCLKSLQSQIDSVASKDMFDELTATVFYSDAASVSDLYAGSISLSGADLATSLSSLSSRSTSLEGRATNLESRATALEGYFTGGVAKSALRLSGTAAYSVWGVEYWADGVPKSVTGRPGLFIGTTQVQVSAAVQSLAGITSLTMNGALSGATTISASVSVTTPRLYLGTYNGNDVYLVLDSQAGGVHVVNAGLYSDSFVTAGGAGSSGGGGGETDLKQVWTSLANRSIDQDSQITSSIKIATAHLPIIEYSGTGFVTELGYRTSANETYLTATRRALTANDIPSLTVSKISDIGTWIAGYNFATQSQLAAKQDVISDLSTIRSNATNGNTAYGWGNHANAGYLTSADGTTISTALQSLQSQIDSVSARNNYDELTATTLFSDIVTASSAYIDSITGSLSGNATTASYVVGSSYGVGGAYNPVYFSGGRPVATTATVGSAAVPMWLNGGTLTAITPSSLFSALSSSAATNLSATVAGQNRTIADLYARYDKDGGEIAPNMTAIGLALRSLQSQVDSVSARNCYDELTATTFYSDMLSVGADAYVGSYLYIGGTTAYINYVSGNSGLHTNVGIYSDSYVTAGAAASSSDARLKDDITAVSASRAWGVLMALKPSEWTWNGKKPYLEGKRGAGLVAQEVAPVLPDAVLDLNGELSLQYNMLHAYEIAGLQDHERRIKELERENAELKKKLEYANT